MKKLKKVKKSYGAGGKNTKPKMLKGGQAKLDKNKNGKIDANDLAMLRSMKKLMKKYGGKN